MSNDAEIDQYLAERQRERNRRRLRRVGLFVGVVVAIIVLAYLSEPFLRSARNEGQEASAIGSLRAILSAQMVFTTSTCSGYYAATLTQLGRPGAGGVAPLSGDLAFADRVEKSGYQIWIDAEPAADAPECNGLPAGRVARSFVIRAEPLPGEGERFFALTSASADIYAGTESIRVANGVVVGDAKPLR